MDGLMAFVTLGLLVFLWVFWFNRGTNRDRTDKERAIDDHLSVLNFLNQEQADRARREQDAQTTGFWHHAQANQAAANQPAADLTNPPPWCDPSPAQANQPSWRDPSGQTNQPSWCDPSQQTNQPCDWTGTNLN